jgi:hypothetical protein
MPRKPSTMPGDREAADWLGLDVETYRELFPRAGTATEERQAEIVGIVLDEGEFGVSEMIASALDGASLGDIYVASGRRRYA